MADVGNPRSTTANGYLTPTAPSAPSSSSQSVSPPLSRPNNANVIPGASRLRHPPPPSPLSRVRSSSPVSSDDTTTNSNTTALALPIPPSSPRSAKRLPSSGTGPGAAPPDDSSPCFIHSHLDKHGSLQEWMRTSGREFAAPPHPASPTRHGHGHRVTTTVHAVGSRHAVRRPLVSSIPSQPHVRSEPPSAATSPPSAATSPPLRDPSVSGYESDKSSMSRFEGSAILDGDLMDDDEEARSLTRQLAETAQGVREMSKELGRTTVRSRIQHVLIVTKARDNRLIKLTRELALYLMQKRPKPSHSTVDLRSIRPNGESSRGMVVYVDAQLRTSKRFDAAGIQREYPSLFEPVTRRRSSSSASINNMSAYPSTASMAETAKRARDEGQLRYWTAEMCSNSPQLFDFVITLGGDGTVLFTSWLFQKIVPPVLPFALGSLGFLTNFDFAQYAKTMDRVVDDGIRVNLRMRFTCTVYRAIAPEEALIVAKGNKRKAIKRPDGEILINQVDKGGWEALEGMSPNLPFAHLDGKKDKEIMCFTTRPVEQFEILNDLVVDRGPSPYVSLLEVFGDEHHLTTVQADGLTVSTPTGSTAYSLSAGGSLVHPQIPALLLTPICPHTLSFRPMLLPDSMELRVCVPYNSRSTAWASFDGRGRVELKQGDHIKITASKYPFPTVCADKQSTDWFQSISRTLRWNEREKQKSFVVVEEDHEPTKRGHRKAEKKQAPIHEEAAEAEAEVEAKTDKIKIAAEEEEVKVEAEPDIDDEEEDDDDEEEEEEFDIDDKSGGEVTPSSPTKQAPLVPSKLKDLIHAHKSGVESPDRFFTPCHAPPPISQRHLLDALASADLNGKDNEDGQHDDIRGDPSAYRVDGGQHLIPVGRLTPVQAERPESPRTPTASRHDRDVANSHAQTQTPKSKGKSKAFAFFGQDDSGSDPSDITSD